MNNKHRLAVRLAKPTICMLYSRRTHDFFCTQAEAESFAAFNWEKKDTFETSK